MRRRLCLLLPFLLLLLQPASAAARQPQRGDELTVFIATVGQGSFVWELFGHNAIWITDATTGTTTAYNYGMFDFQQEAFVPRLMRGNMLYSMRARAADQELAEYAWSNRSVWLQRLNMTAAQKHALREFLEWNLLPENADYLYDYFRDNCSTRIRDAIDRALGGAFAAATRDVSTGTTYRWHSLRLTQARVPVFTGLLLGLGSPTDRPIDAWEESFLPMQLMHHLRSVSVTLADGSRAPLVAEETTLFASTAPAEADGVPSWLHWYLLAGVLTGALFLWLGRRARTRPRARLGLAVGVSVWGVITGFFGLILLLLWVATDHSASHANQNLLQVSPLALLLAVIAPLALAPRAAARPRRQRLAQRTALALAALSAAGLLLHVFPFAAQANGRIIALVLPVHIAVAAALYYGMRRDPSSAEDVSARMSVPAAA